MLSQSAQRLKIWGRFYSDAGLWQFVSRRIGKRIRNADSFYDVLTDPSETAENFQILWNLPKQPLSATECKLFDLLLDVARARTDIKVEFPDPPRWLLRHQEIG